MVRSNPQAEQHFVAGQELMATGRRGEAQQAYRRALASEGGFVPALFALGQSLAAEGRLAEAQVLLGDALSRSAGDARAESVIAPALAQLLEMARPTAFDLRIERLLLQCLGSPAVDAQMLAGFSAEFLLRKYPDPDADLGSVGRDPLWTEYLTRCLNCSSAIERRLTLLRRSLSLDHAGGKPLKHDAEKCATVLAIQAFVGEYVWAVEEHEQAALAGPIHPLIAAMYRPLAEFVTPQEARRMRRDRLSKLLVDRTFVHLEQERGLAVSLPTLIENAGANAISARVRDQYEENPYPRWQQQPRPRARPLLETVGELPGIDRAALADGPPDVLVAGCGTGFETAGLALTDPEARLTGLDLSRSSLAHAQRQFAELGLDNIALIHGDILNAENLGRQFDLIYSTGVLHHMERPADGLAALVSVLKPGGAVRIGLYSHRARAAIRDSRALIAERGWPATPEGIRAFRAEALTLPGETMKRLVASPDFNSLSGCRDLVFHVQEHQFTPLEALALIEGAGLGFAGIEPRADVMSQFMSRFGPAADPRDVGMWDQLEAEDPSIFASMILLWAQKPVHA